MAYRRLVSLIDVAKAGYWVSLRCPCGHEAKHDPMLIVEKLASRGADIRLAQLGKSMKCSSCGGKDFIAAHCQGPERWSG